MAVPRVSVHLLQSANWQLLGDLASQQPYILGLAESYSRRDSSFPAKRRDKLLKRLSNGDLARNILQYLHTSNQCSKPGPAVHLAAISERPLIRAFHNRLEHQPFDSAGMRNQSVFTTLLQLNSSCLTSSQRYTVTVKLVFIATRQTMANVSTIFTSPKAPFGGTLVCTPTKALAF